MFPVRFAHSLLCTGNCEAADIDGWEHEVSASRDT